MHELNRQIQLILRKASFLYSDSTVRKKEKQTFLTMKIDNDSLLLRHDAGNLNDETFPFLYDINQYNLILRLWNYPKFDHGILENDDCVSEFLFKKKDDFTLGEMLEIPESIICYSGTKVDGTKSFCMFLKRFANPCRYSGMIS